MATIAARSDSGNARIRGFTGFGFPGFCLEGKLFICLSRRFPTRPEQDTDGPLGFSRSEEESPEGNRYDISGMTLSFAKNMSVPSTFSLSARIVHSLMLPIIMCVFR